MNQSHRPRRAQLRIVLLPLPSELNAPSQKSPEADRCRSASLHPVCQCARLARRRARRLLLLLRADSLYPSQHSRFTQKTSPSFVLVVSRIAFRPTLPPSANTLPLLTRGSSVLS